MLMFSLKRHFSIKSLLADLSDESKDWNERDEKHDEHVHSLATLGGGGDPTELVQRLQTDGDGVGHALVHRTRRVAIRTNALESSEDHPFHASTP